MMTLNKIKDIISVNKITPPKKNDHNLNDEIFQEKVDNWSNQNFYEIKFKYKNKVVTGYIIEPKTQSNFPCIIYNRGGIGKFGQIEDKHIFYILSDMASWGYVVTAVEYGDFDEYGGEDVEYVKELHKILKNYDKINSVQTGLFGASRGGMMNYLLLKEKNFAKCAVIKAGVSDQNRGYKLRPELKKIDSNFYDSSNKQEIYNRSSINWIKDICQNCPIMLLHGLGDTQVSPLDSLDVAYELYKYNRSFSLLLFNKDNHRLSINKQLVQSQTKKWFDTYLKGEEK